MNFINKAVDGISSFFAPSGGSGKPSDLSLDVMDQVDEQRLDCLNCSKEHTVQHLMQNSKPSSRFNSNLFIESKNDEQLLIFIPFKNKVHIRQIAFQAPQDESCPNTIKLFINQEAGMDFDDASNAIPTEIISLSQHDANPKNPKLFNVKLTKFRNVSSLTIFIEDNHGHETTKLYSVRVGGQILEGMNMNELKSQGPS
jgi:hypothetical protein